ncbi:MAG TPA: DinB family protein [Blastocatellia bacterium]|nr:DinB family protein [Blastocatellia bacterium]
MVTNIADRYRRWFEYEMDAHSKVLESLEAANAQGPSPSFQKAYDLFAHVVAARRLWLYRFGMLEEGPRDLFPKDVPLETLRPITEETQALWSAYFSRVDDVELARVFEYVSLDAGAFRNSVEDILTQLFGHSWYHRGQIALLLRSGGGEPAATDFVFWCREPIQGQAVR